MSIINAYFIFFFETIMHTLYMYYIYIYIVRLICQKGSTLHHAGRSWVCSAAAAGARTSTPLCASARKPG